MSLYHLSTIFPCTGLWSPYRMLPEPTKNHLYIPMSASASVLYNWNHSHNHFISGSKWINFPASNACLPECSINTLPESECPPCRLHSPGPHPQVLRIRRFGFLVGLTWLTCHPYTWMPISELPTWNEPSDSTHFERHPSWCRSSSINSIAHFNKVDFA